VLFPITAKVVSSNPTHGEKNKFFFVPFPIFYTIHITCTPTIHYINTTRPVTFYHNSHYSMADNELRDEDEGVLRCVMILQG